MSFPKTQELLDFTQEMRDELALRGRMKLQFKDQECMSYAKNAVSTTMTLGEKNYTVFLTCCPRVYRSDVGNLICSQYNCDFAAMYWYDFSSHEWWISLRASGSSKVDLSELTATLPNGGGHPKAAGFVIGKEQTLETYFTKN